LDFFKLEPAPNALPEKLETGTINFEGLVGVTEAVRLIASLGKGNLLKEQLLSAYEKMTAYENHLADYLRNELAKLDYVTLYQANNSVEKTPTIAFRIADLEPKLICHHLAQSFGIHLEYGNFYAMTLVDKLQLNDGGLIRAGIAPYNTMEEIERLIAGVK